ncbi:MAG: hypothetical protein ACREMB_12670 [Candidatus Rokuibacteriota bacterium]
MSAPEAWEAARARIAGLLARRDALLEETARAWAAFARRQGWTRDDVVSLWEGLTEDVVRQVTRARRADPATAPGDVVATMARLREHILTVLER